MLEDTPSESGSGTEAGPETGTPAKKATTRKTAAKKATTTTTTRKRSTKKAAAASEPAPEVPAESAADAPEPAAPVKKAAKRAPAKKAAAKKAAAAPAVPAVPDETSETPEAPAADKPVVKRTTRARKAAPAPAPEPATDSAPATPEAPAAAPDAAVPLFQAPDATTVTVRKRSARKAAPKQQPAEESADATPDAPAEAAPEATAEQGSEKPAGGATRRQQSRGGRASDPAAGDAEATTDDDTETSSDSDDDESADGSESGEGSGRRRRRRGGRRRRKSGGDGPDDSGDEADASGEGRAGDDADTQDKQDGQKQDGQKQGRQQQDDKQADKQQDDKQDDGESGSSSRRRRRRRRSGEDGGEGGDDPQNTVTRVRQGRTGEDQITAVSGSTRLEAKKQRRREGREAGRRRAPIVSEAEFLARRESVERVMAIRQRDDLTQIAVLEDKVLVEHYVARESQTSIIGNVYLGRVQNVLPSMEAAFIDIGKGRNAVLYAGEVNWSSLGHKDGQPRKIESVLSSGQTVLVQVTKDPVGHKGARLTSQISLAGRFLVYVPDGTNSGISRKLPDTERSRLKTLLKEIVPDSAGVIVRTAAEGASEDELTRDVERLKARWEDIEKGAKKGGSAPQLLYGEPDLMLKVVRDLFTEDFAKLVVQGDDAWDTVQGYVTHVAPDLEERLEKYDPAGADLFAAYRVDEQIHKGLDRKVWLPSGGSLVIDRTEAMTVVDVNTGKFTGSGGNLEETVTKNNLEAAEEIVRQLRLRDIGGIIVVDFIDMVLESNRDLVLRRLVECLGRDRTRHQVAEVTSLGLVQMTRKRIGTGLLEAFSENCEHCAGRGVVIADAPVEPKKEQQDSKRGGARRSKRGRGGDDQGGQSDTSQDQVEKAPSPKDVAAMARPPQPEADSDASADAASETPSDTQLPEQASEVAAPEPTEPTEPTEPAPPTVTRTTRKRTPRTPRTASAAEAPEAPETAAPAEPAAAPAEPDPAPVVPPAAEPAAPKVVTRTRGRSASRPAGPPAGSPGLEVPVMAADSAPATTRTGVVGAPPADGVVEPGTAAAESGAGAADDEPAAVEHVPVKKRGARKR